MEKEVRYKIKFFLRVMKLCGVWCTELYLNVENSCFGILMIAAILGRFSFFS